MAESIDSKTLYFMEEHGLFYSNSEQRQLREMPDNTRLPGGTCPEIKAIYRLNIWPKRRSFSRGLKGFYLRF